MMDLTEGQQRGLDMVQQLMKAPSTRVGVLAGYAGTGKTTLLREIANTIGMPIVISPTGKAAARVKQASGLPAMTIHRWQYQPEEDPITHTTVYKRVPPDRLARGSAGLIVVEESSMVSRSLWNDILDNALILGVKVLCIGDPFQLPPVDPEDKDPAGFSILNKGNDFVDAYVLMKDIVRQALESPIVRASMAIRGGDAFKGISELPKVLPQDFLDKGDQIQARGGIVIVHKNKTRNTLNQRIRVARRMPDGALQDGEPLLVIRNNYNVQAFNGESYQFEGWAEPPMGMHTVWDYVRKEKEESRFGIARILEPEGGRRFQAVLSEGEVFGSMAAPPQAIGKTADIVHPNQPFVDANLGYVMTAHKAQGSEWDEVLVGIEPSVPFWREDGLRWLYTALTRSRKVSRVCVGASV